MKKTPKILPTYYKSKGTPIFRDTTALPFAIGGPLEDEPRKPGSPPSWNRPQLSEERIEALKELHGDSIFASANPNDLLFYDLNKDAIEQAEDFSKFLDPSAKVNPRFTDAIMTKDIKTRLSKQGYALDTKTGNYFKIPDEVYKQIVVKEDPLTKLATLEPAKVDRALLELQQRPMSVLPEYTKPAYHIDMPTITMAHHHSGQLIPHARPQVHSTRVPGLIPSIVQNMTGYDKAFMEGTYDAEGNYLPGEIENAQQQNRPINFVGANSLRDLKAQKQYQEALRINTFGQGGFFDYPLSDYASDASVQYAGGGPIGPIYTYDKRPGSYYQRAQDGSWMISNAGTNNQYVPIDDLTGKRTELLNKHAVVYNAPVQGAPKITPAPIKTQQVAAQKNSPVLAEQKQYKQAQKEQKVFDSNQAKQQAYEQALAKTKLQSAQPADWVFAAPMVAPMALEGLGAAMSIPLGGGVTTGGALGAAGFVHGATQIDDRYKDWQSVAQGNMDWKEAALKTGFTGLDLAGGILPIHNATNIIRSSNAPKAFKAQSLVTPNANKKVVGVLDEFGDLVEDVPQYFPIGESVPINTKTATAVDLSNKPYAISLDEFREAKKAAETNNWRFVTPKSELDFLASKYADDFSAKYGIPVEKLNSYDVAMYGKLREAEHIPTIETVPAIEKLAGTKKAAHNSFVDTHKPTLELNPTEELVTDAYTRGYDSIINQRDLSRPGAFYENEVAPILEQTILKNKFQQETPLVRGTKDFTIDGRATLLRNNQALDNLKFSQLQEGDIFIPNSFTSTSIEGINAENLNETPFTSFTRGIKNFDHVIKAPAGQSYLYPNASNIQNYTTEMEAILPKNLQFKVDKVVSDLDRGYLGTAADIKRGEYYGIGNNKFTKVPNRFFPSIQRFDKVKTVDRDLNTGELTYGKVSKKGVKNLIKYHNEQHHPVIPKYYFSIVNPYLFGGKLNKNC